jgi:hypothetical protein
MTWTLTVGGTDRTAVADRTAISLSQTSFRGEVAQAGFDLADDAAAVSLPSLKVVEFAESGTTLWRGRIAAKDVGRGMIFSGSARQYNVTMWDSNADLSGIPVDKWIRPAETDVARALALASAFLNGSPRASTVIGTAHVPNANTVALPAKTYEATTPHEVLAELDEWTGKTHFVIVNGDGSMDLFYAVDTYTGFASSLAISDSAFNDTTILAPIIESPPLTEEGSEIYTGGTIIYGDANTRLSATRTTPESLHDYWHIAYWDSEARSAADATNRLAVMLDGAQAEELTYRCQIEVLIAQIDNIKCGQTISFRCAAAKVMSNTTLRIVRLTWKPPEHPEGPYLVDLELSVPSKTRKRRPPPGAAGTGSGTGGDGGHGDVPPTDPSPCDNCPPFVAPAPTLLHTYNLHYLDGTAIAGPSTLDGDFSGSWQISSGTQFWSPGGTSLVGYDLKHFGTTTAPPDPSGVHNHRREFLALVVGGTATHARLTGRIGNTGSIAPVNWTLEAGNWPIARPSAGGTPPVYGYIGSGIAGGTLTVASPFASIDVTWPISGGMAQWVLKVTTDPTVAGDFSGVGIDDPTAPDTTWTLRTYQSSTTVPVSGQFVGSDVPTGSVDGSNATFATTFPYMAGSLSVTVNSVDWTSEITSQNPSTGSFTLSHPPKAGSDVVVMYRSA